MPVAGAGEADFDACHGPGSRPGLAAYRARARAQRRAGGRGGDARAHAHQVDGLGGAVGPLVHVVPGLELAGVRLGQDVDPLEPFHRGDGVPVGHDDPEGRSVVGTQRLAVHLVGDQDLRGRIGGVCERQGADEGQVVLVGVGEHGVEVVRAVVGALEAHVDAVCPGTRLLEHLVEQGALPAGGRDGVVAPGLTGRQRPHLEPPVAGALERDRALVRRHGAEVVERQRQRVLDRAADLERAVVGRQREVAAHVVELGGSDLAGQGFGRRLRVVRSRVDHLQRGARAGEIVCDCHVSVSCRPDQ